ncbi:MAG: thrombospondin type 3 repeat-containing protein [Chloroflexota bacterium]|nr:thrombospondin type 3 repeat-containing protein [Chloroflexota bacterium]
MNRHVVVSVASGQRTGARWHRGPSGVHVVAAFLCLMVAFMALIQATPNASAQIDRGNCSLLGDQETAQRYLDEGIIDAAVLDPDGNGIACDNPGNAPGGVEPAPTGSDTDGDGLLDEDEAREGTDPANPDTDGDELTDGEEVERRVTPRACCNPLDADSDDDDLADGYEVHTSGTGATNPDSDGDGANDGAEVAAGTDPLDPASTPNPASGDAVAITVRAFLCPFGFEGGDVYTGCVEPAEDVLVSLSRDGTFLAEDEIGADGSVVFGDLATGTFTIELGVPGDFADFRTACGAPGANEGLTIDGAGTNRIGITLGEGARPTCTFFVIREDAGGVTPTPVTPETTPAAPVATNPAGSVVGLPNTGTGPTGTAAPSGTTLLVLLSLGALLSGGVAAHRLRLR